MQYQQKSSYKGLNAVSVMVGLLGLVSITWAQGHDWTTKAEMPTARHHLSTSVVGGMIYAIGGTHGDEFTAHAEVEVYDPATDTWTPKTDMPTARGYFSTSVVGGMIYAIGGMGTGLNSWPTYAVVEAYDPATDTWTPKADMPTARWGFGASVVDGRIYVIGGSPSTSSSYTHLATVEAYDPVTDTWTSKADMPIALRAFSTSAVNGKIYAFGGKNNTEKGRVNVFEYDPATDTWTPKADMPTGRENLATSVVNGRIYAIGGRAPSGILSLVEEYDPATDTWTSKADMPTARSALATTVAADKIYAIGGATTPFPPLECSMVEVYDPGLASGPTSIQALGWGVIKALMRR